MIRTLSQTNSIIGRTDMHLKMSGLNDPIAGFLFRHLPSANFANC